MKRWNSRLIRTPREVIESHIARDAITDCWNWTGATINGYGQLTYRQRHYAAHRFAYTHLVGWIPSGIWILHRCDNRLCVNPKHLYPGNAVDNRRDTLERSDWSHPYGKRTHCFAGHQYEPGSYRIAKDGSRICKVCMSAYQREYRKTHPQQKRKATA